MNHWLYLIESKTWDAPIRSLVPSYRASVISVKFLRSAEKGYLKTKPTPASLFTSLLSGVKYRGISAAA